MKFERSIVHYVIIVAACLAVVGGTAAIFYAVHVGRKTYNGRTIH